MKNSYQISILVSTRLILLKFNVSYNTEERKYVPKTLHPFRGFITITVFSLDIEVCCCFLHLAGAAWTER